MAKRTKESDKALGQDPFEDMEMNGLDQEAVDETEAEKKAAAKARAKPKPEKEATTEAEVKAEAEKKAATKAKAKRRTRKRTGTEAEVKAEAQKKAATKAKAKRRTRKRTETEAEVKAEVQKKAATKAKAKPRARKRTETEAEVKPEAEVAADAEGPVSEVVAEPDEEASRLLDELIATIDTEVEEAFGPGAMADLAFEQMGAAGEEQHVIFTLAGTEYAVPIANVTEVGQPLDVTPVPNVPDWVLGVANLRGDIISMVDLRAFLGMEQISYAQDSRMLVAQARQADMTTGLIVDQVSGIRYLPMDRIGEPTAPIEDQVAPYLHGVYEHDDHLLVVLNLDRLLVSSGMRQFEPV